MKICAYVQRQYAKKNYKKECLDTRQFVGLRMIIDCLERAGYTVEYAGQSTVHRYDIVLVSITAACDWWSYITERMGWRPGSYKVLVGGAGVLHIEPFLPWFDIAMFGRGEDLIVPLVKGIESGQGYENPSICYASQFSQNRIYYIRQATQLYDRPIPLTHNRAYNESAIGCNHKCLFCGYTWHRKFLSIHGEFQMENSMFTDMANKERAMLDLYHDPDKIDFHHLRTTAIDGFSERLRIAVGKPITHEVFNLFLRTMLTNSVNPHQIKLYNICGYPTETEEDWMEFMDELNEADSQVPVREKQWSIVLHSTPFRAMPATPLACAPMSKRNYRGAFGRILGAGLKGNLIYQGKSLWAVESMGTDSPQAIMLDAIAHRGHTHDSENIMKLCASPKFWSASAATKEATLCKYFNMDYLFGAFTAETLPSRYLRTYAGVERMWGKTALERGG